MKLVGEIDGMTTPSSVGLRTCATLTIFAELVVIDIFDTNFPLDRNGRRAVYLDYEEKRTFPLSHSCTY